MEKLKLDPLIGPTKGWVLVVISLFLRESSSVESTRVMGSTPPVGEIWDKSCECEEWKDTNELIPCKTNY